MQWVRDVANAKHTCPWWDGGGKNMLKDRNNPERWDGNLVTNPGGLINGLRKISSWEEIFK
jgi:hypothetical protein